jgi:hypothetical protein
MQKPTIGELIKTESGYTSYVDLRLELYDDAKNIGRMERYRPISSHRYAFKTLSKSLEMKDERCYLLTGSYGTGKSHLCLMFANYLQTPANVSPMPRFFENYSEVDPHESNALQTRRANGCYLVALCQWGGNEDFDEVVLKAVNEALMREGFGEDFDTQYLQAVKKIEEWARLAETGETRFFDDFERELTETNAGLTIGLFKKKLNVYDNEALHEFKRIHKKITTAEFTLERTNLIDILIGTLSSEKFKERFLGLLVLWDEFGDNMERGAMHPKAFQRFAHLCAETPTNCCRLIFVGTAHKNLTDYSKSYNSIDFRTASDRIKQVALTPDGVEEIISAIVVPQKQCPLWQEYVDPRTEVFDGFGADCTRLKLFDWLKAPQVRTKIIENIYPMHPMATFSLLQLARDVASNNRSVYTFFSKPDQGSYPDFIQTEPILKDAKLNLYTADRLCDYFADTLKSDNKELRETVRERIRDYENSVRAVNQVSNSGTLESAHYKDDSLLRRLMRIMLVYEIIGKQNSFDNLAFGLYCNTHAEKQELKNRLEALVAKNVLYLVKETSVYEFKKSNAVNIDAIVESWVKNPANSVQNVVAELSELVPLEKGAQYLEAKNYNAQFSEDKQLLRSFARATDLSVQEDTPQGKLDFFQKLENEIVDSIAKKNEYEGIALYVACETQEEIAKAKDFCAHNESDRIVVAIPKQPVPLLNAIMEYKALIAIEQSDEYKNFSTQDKSSLSARLIGDSNRPGAKLVLTKLRDKFMNAKEVSWYGKFAQTIKVDEMNPYDVANLVAGKLYTDRNTFIHDDFNKLHNKVDKARSQALKEAVEKLLKFTEPIAIETDLPQQRGDNRYLRRCLEENGVLRVVKAEGYTLRCEFEDNPDIYKAKLPALAEMVNEIRGLDGNSKIRIANWVLKFRLPTYGQGPVSLVLSLACLRHLFRDSIRFKEDETSIGDMAVRTFDEMLMLTDGTRPNAFLSYRPLGTLERAIVKNIYNLFGEPDTAVSKDYTVAEVHAAMKSWWDGLAPVAKIAKLYNYDPVADAFIGVMQKIAGKDAHTFIFDELPTAFGLDSGLAVNQELVDALTDDLPNVKAQLDGGLSALEERIIDGVRGIFGIEQNTYSDIVAGISQWYNKLDSQQRDQFKKQTNASKPLLLHLKSLSDLRQTFLVDIPKTTEYGSNAVQNWASDKVAEYLNQIRSGKEYIDANRIKVEPPRLEVDNASEWLDGDDLSFKDKVELKFADLKHDAKLFITEGNADPLDPTAPRQEWKADESLVIRENKTIRYAVQDNEGNWSPVKEVHLINTNAPYLPTIGVPHLLDKMRLVQFYLKDADSLSVACRELFSQCIKLGIMDVSQMESAVTEALKAAKSML